MTKTMLLAAVVSAVFAATSACRGQSSDPIPAPPSMAWAGGLSVEPSGEFERAARRLLLKWPAARLEPLLDEVDRAALPAALPVVRVVSRVRATFTTSSLTGHPSLPFGTLLRVTNVKNGRSVEVRIADRCRRCQINLSIEAARAIGLTTDGVGMVDLAVLGPAPPAASE